MEKKNLLLPGAGLVIVAQLYYKHGYKCPGCECDHGYSGSRVYNKGYVNRYTGGRGRETVENEG